MEKIPAKKSLGQNFLKSKMALFKMIEAGEISQEDTILEVGPGKGVLTEKLLEKAGKVIAIEKDHRLIELLQEKFSTEISSSKLILLNEDILDFVPEKFGLSNGDYKLIANIPYYITGQFLRKFLESDHQPERIIVMVQKEIAQRIVAKGSNGGGDGKESLLSISVKAYGQPKMIMKVDKENFSPAPKVDSAILAINNISKNFFTENKVDEKKFFEVLHAGFAHKRKMLLGNLKEWQKKVGDDKKININFEEAFSKLNISKKIRAEDLKLNQWTKIIKNIN